MNIESQEQTEDIIVRKGLFRKKVNLNRLQGEEKTLHDSWLFRCGSISEYIQHKDMTKYVRVKNEGWIWHLEKYLRGGLR